MTEPKQPEELLRDAYRGLQQQTKEHTAALEQQIVERGRTEESLRALTAQLLTLRDDEQRRIARELHDSVGQLVVALAMNTAIIAADQTLGPIAARANRDNAHWLEQLSTEIRTLSHLLHPPLLEEAGLQSALPWYVEGFSERSRIEVRLEIAADFGRLSSDLETTIFRVVQECLTNIHRHSGATAASIFLDRGHSEVRVTVADQGRGIAPAKLRSLNAEASGVGIRGMRERVRRRGGSFSIDSDVRGTAVSIVLPLGARAE